MEEKNKNQEKSSWINILEERKIIDTQSVQLNVQIEERKKELLTQLEENEEKKKKKMETLKQELSDAQNVGDMDRVKKLLEQMMI